jgi:hypothetical protein
MTAACGLSSGGPLRRLEGRRNFGLAMLWEVSGLVLNSPIQMAPLTSCAGSSRVLEMLVV